MSTYAQRPYVLIVDDDDGMCWALGQIIAAQGHHSAVAKTAKEALRRLECETFHLAFIDVKLPDINGFDLVRAIAARAPGLPCVLVSGLLYEDDELVRAARSSRLIAGFIGKPFLLAQIRDALHQVAMSPRTEPQSGGGGHSIPPGGIEGPPCDASAGASDRPSADRETPNALPLQQLEALRKNPSHPGTPFA